MNLFLKACQLQQQNNNKRRSFGRLHWVNWLNYLNVHHRTTFSTSQVTNLKRSLTQINIGNSTIQRICIFYCSLFNIPHFMHLIWVDSFRILDIHLHRSPESTKYLADAVLLSDFYCLFFDQSFTIFGWNFVFFYI